MMLDAGVHFGAVSALCFSPNGSHLYSISEDKTVRVWRTADRTCVDVLRPPIGLGERGKLYTGAVSPDGTLLAIGGFGIDYPSDHRVLVIDLKTRRLIHVRGHSDAIDCLAFSPDGNFLASGGHDETVRVYRVRELRAGLARPSDPALPDNYAWLEPESFVMSAHHGHVYGLAFSPDSKSLLSGANNGTVFLWSFSSSTPAKQLPNHATPVYAVAWRSDSNRLYVGGADGLLRSCHPDGLDPQYVTIGKKAITSISCTSDSKYLFCDSEGVSMIALPSLMQKKVAQRKEAVAECVALHPTLPIVASGYDDGGVYISSIESGEYIGEFGNTRFHPIRRLAWSHDAPLLGFSFTESKGVQDPTQVDLAFDFNSFSIRSPTNTKWLPPKIQSKFASLVTKGGIVIVTSKRAEAKKDDSQKIGVEIVDPPYEIVADNGDAITASSFVGENVVVGSKWRLYLHDPHDRRKVRSLRAHLQTVRSITTNWTDTLLASGGDDRFVCLWNGKSHRPLLTLVVAGAEWAAWTPVGYYACSDGAESMLGWHVDRGYGCLADFIPNAKADNYLRRTDVLRGVVARAELHETLADLHVPDPREDVRRRLTEKSDAPERDPTILSDQITVYRKIEARQRSVGMTAPDPERIRQEFQAISRIVEDEVGDGKSPIVSIPTEIGKDIPTRFEHPVSYHLLQELLGEVQATAYDLNLELRRPPKIATLSMRRLDANTERYESLDDHVIYCDPLLLSLIHEFNKAVFTVFGRASAASKGSFGAKDCKIVIESDIELRDAFVHTLAELIGRSAIGPRPRLKIPKAPVAYFTHEAELFLIAHEYAHAAYRHRGVREAISVGLELDPGAAHALLSGHIAHRWKQELFADFIGGKLALAAIYRIDREERMTGAEGAGIDLFFTYNDIAEEAQRIIRGEPPIKSDTEDMKFLKAMVEASTASESELGAILHRAGSVETVKKWSKHLHPPAFLRRHYVQSGKRATSHAGEQLNNMFTYIALQLWESSKDQFKRTYASEK